MCRSLLPGFFLVFALSRVMIDDLEEFIKIRTPGGFGPTTRLDYTHAFPHGEIVSSLDLSRSPTSFFFPLKKTLLSYDPGRTLYRVVLYLPQQ